MTTSPSHLEKLDPRLYLVIGGILVFFELLDIGKNAGEALQPEFLAKFKKEGCPDWTHMYNLRKIKMGKILKAVIDDFSEELKTELIKLLEIRNADDCLTRFFEVCEKHGEEILNCFRGVWLRKNIKNFLVFYHISRMFLCPGLFGERLNDLLKRANKGDRDAILKLVQVDKSLIGARWSLREIRMAQASGDLEYLAKLAKAMRTNHYNPKKRNYKLTLVLVCGWKLGLNMLTNDELCDLVRDFKVYNGDVETLYREVKRLGLRKDRKPATAGLAKGGQK